MYRLLIVLLLAGCASTETIKSVEAPLSVAPKPVIVASPTASPVSASVVIPPPVIKTIAVPVAVSSPAEYTPLTVPKVSALVTRVHAKPKSRLAVTPVAISSVSEQLSTASLGSFSYEVPRTMRLGKVERVSIRLSKSLLQKYSSLTPVEVAQIKVYPFMSVKLMGEPQFKIIPLSTENQIVDSDITEWLFTVVPQSSGNQKLFIRISARIKTGEGSEEVIDLPVRTEEISVSVSWIYLTKTFVTTNWQALIGIITSSGLIGWLFKRKKESI